MKRLLIRVFIVAFIISLSACSPVEPSITYAENNCTYEGPSKISMPFNINWVIEDPANDGAILQLVSLDAGKTVKDLAAIPAADPPPDWVHKLSYAIEFGKGNYKASFDLSNNASYKGEPIYLACFYADQESAMGAAGPFEIKQ
jgi:hypothetical protein